MTRPAFWAGLAIGLVAALAAPGLVAWIIFVAVIVVGLVWSALEMRPTPVRRRIVGSILNRRHP